MRGLRSVLFAVTCALAGPVLAKAPACDLERVAFPYEVTNAAGRWGGTRDFEMVLSRNTCKVKHIWTPSRACDFVYGTSHGYTAVFCARSLPATWRMLAASDRRSYFETVNEGARTIVPSLSKLKSIYAHLDDDDAAKPIYKDDFPKRFTYIGPRTPVGNPDVEASMQSFRYRTMAGEDRLGISADAVVGCLKYQFGVILRVVQPDDADRLRDVNRKDMASFLSDLRLEPVNDPVERLRDLKPSFNREGMLKPIMACVPH